MVKFEGDQAPNVALTGSLTVKGSGALEININHFDINGAVKLSDASTTKIFEAEVDTDGPQTNIGSLSVTGGGGGTIIELENMNVNGNAVLKLGNGTNSVHLGTSAADHAVTVKGNLLITGGTGNDTVLLKQTTIWGNLEAGLRKGSDAFETNFNCAVYCDIYIDGNGELEAELEDTSVWGYVNIDASGSNDKAFIHIDDADIWGNLDIWTGGGDDLVAIQGIMHGKTNVKTNGGNDTIVIADASLRALHLSTGARCAIRTAFTEIVA